MHWIHSPGFKDTLLGAPAELILAIVNVTGFSGLAPFVSLDRTANPSMAELSNCGDGKDATTSCPKTRFPARVRCTRSDCNSNVLLLIIDFAS